MSRKRKMTTVAEFLRQFFEELGLEIGNSAPSMVERMLERDGEALDYDAELATADDLVTCCNGSLERALDVLRAYKAVSGKQMGGEEQTQKRHLEEMHRRLSALKASGSPRRQANDSLGNEQRTLRQLLGLQERERRLVAYELHDGLAQQLSCALMRLQAFAQLSDWNSREARKTFDVAIQSLNDGLIETRQLIRGLQPSIFAHAGLAAAIDRLVFEVREREGVKIEFDCNDQFGRLAAPLETAVFRIVQEALNNACRHSQSDKFRVALITRGGRIRVEVQDWGIGFDLGTVKENCFGLRGIRERAEILDGQATIDQPQTTDRELLSTYRCGRPRALLATQRLTRHAVRRG